MGTGGYPVTRMWSNQEWALQGLPGVQDIIDYEARINYVRPKLLEVFIWAHNFSAALMTQMMRPHPHVVIDGMLRDKPLHAPREEFLKRSPRRFNSVWTRDGTNLATRTLDRSFAMNTNAVPSAFAYSPETTGWSTRCGPMRFYQTTMNRAIYAYDINFLNQSRNRYPACAHLVAAIGFLVGNNFFTTSDDLLREVR